MIVEVVAASFGKVAGPEEELLAELRLMTSWVDADEVDDDFGGHPDL